MNTKQAAKLSQNLNNISYNEKVQVLSELLKTIKANAVKWTFGKTLSKKRYRYVNSISREKIEIWKLFANDFLHENYCDFPKKFSSKRRQRSINKLLYKFINNKKIVKKGRFAENVGIKFYPKWIENIFHALDNISPLDARNLIKNNIGLSTMINSGLDEHFLADKLFSKIADDEEVQRVINNERNLDEN